MSELIFSHRVDKSFLKNGFTISKKEESAHQKMIQNAISANIGVKVILNGKTYNATFDNPRKGCYQLMFEETLQNTFQKIYKDCFDYTEDKKNVILKADTLTIIGFYSTEDEYSFEAKQIGNTIKVDATKNKKDYQNYLDSLSGGYAGYVSAIDKMFWS